MRTIPEKFKLLFKPKNMKLHRKILIFLFLITSFILILVALTFKIIVLESYKELEQQEMEKQIKRVVYFLGEELKEIDVISKEYAMWDDTYDFIKDGNQDYINKNITNEFFEYTGLNIFILIDIEGNIVYKNGNNLEKNIETRISESLLQYIVNHKSLLKISENGDGIVGIISSQDEHVLISMSPILTSYYKGPSRGILIVGRYINEKELEQLSEKTQLSISFAEAKEIQQSFNEISLNDLLFNKKLRAWIGKREKKHINGYILINDIEGESEVILKISSTRDIYIEGKSTIFYFMAIIIILALGLLISLWLFMNNVIFKRLNILMDSLSKMEKKIDESATVSTWSSDEFSTLEDEFNNMIKAIDNSQKQIMYQAQHDMLTNLPNRRYFYEQAEELLRQADDENTMAAVLFIDLDHFKSINDSFDHKTGDILLQTIAKRLANIMPENSILSRLGGDEFIAFLSKIQSVLEAEAISSLIIHSFREPFKVNDKELVVSASVGISIYPLDGNTLEELVNNADIAMYKVKKESKNNYKLYKSEMRKRLSEDMLRKALERDELIVYYQPQVNGCTNNIVGVEALLRWEHPILGMISPL